MGDIEILFDVCWILSPSQIQKLISQYHNADYEAPISPDILKAVAARVRPEDKNDQLLLQTEQDEVGPYQIPPPRDIAGLETCTSIVWADTDNARRCPSLAQCASTAQVGDFCGLKLFILWFFHGCARNVNKTYIALVLHMRDYWSEEFAWRRAGHQLDGLVAIRFVTVPV